MLRRENAVFLHSERKSQKLKFDFMKVINILFIKFTNSTCKLEIKFNNKTTFDISVIIR